MIADFFIAYLLFFIFSFFFYGSFLYHSLEEDLKIKKILKQNGLTTYGEITILFLVSFVPFLVLFISPKNFWCKYGYFFVIYLSYKYQNNQRFVKFLNRSVVRA